MGLLSPLDDPNEEITEQWQDGLHDWYTCRDAGQCGVKSATPVPDCVTESFASIGSNAVSVYLTCLECRHQATWSQRTRPTFQEFHELQRVVQAW